MREEYKQKRLKKILALKKKDQIVSERPILEEIEAKPGVKEMKSVQLVQSDESLIAEMGKEDRYI